MKYVNMQNQITLCQPSHLSLDCRPGCLAAAHNFFKELEGVSEMEQSNGNRGIEEERVEEEIEWEEEDGS